MPRAGAGCTAVNRKALDLQQLLPRPGPPTISYQLTQIGTLRHREDPVSFLAPFKEIDMRWEIPQAIEMRFGMEITMYIARR
jgi:coenzyme PQQ precursor peptide PqqA